MPEDHPLNWQMGYSDSEIQDIMSLKFSKAKKPVVQVKKQTTTAMQRIALDEESVCSICCEPMNENTPLTYCRKGCGNNFHIKCIKVWVEHKQFSQKGVTCPLCRTQWGESIVVELKNDEEEFNAKNLVHSIKCQGCSDKAIKGRVFKCSLCNFNLCDRCYNVF